MPRPLAALLPALLLLTGASASNRPKLYAGIYSSGREVESFAPCSSRERWWVVGSDSLHAAYGRVAETAYQRVYVELEGTVSETGRVGHLGQYDRYLSVSRVRRVRPASPQDCKAGRIRSWNALGPVHWPGGSTVL